MKELVAARNGRYLSLEDVQNLQDLAAAWGQVFKKFGNFVAYGCVPTYDESTSTTTITSGYVFLGGRMCAFSGGSISGLHFYFKMKIETESAEYVDGSSGECRKVYTASLTQNVISGSDYVEFVGRYSEDNDAYIFEYNNFENTVIGTEYLKEAADSAAVAEFQSQLRIYKALYLRAFGASADNGIIKVDSEGVFIGSDYDPLSDDNPKGLWVHGTDAGITPDYGNAERYEGDTTFWTKGVRCAEIIPRNPENISQDSQTGHYSSDGEVNVGGTLLTNGKEVATKNWIGGNICEDYTTGSVDNYEGLYAILTFGRIGSVVTVNGYFRSDDYDRDSMSEVEFDISVLAEDNYRPAINVQFPISINMTDNSAIQRGYTGYIRFTTEGKCYMGVNTHGTEENPYYWHNLKVYISGSYVASNAFD